MVEAGSAAAFVADDAGGLEDLQMARRGRPGVAEEARYFACAHFAAGEVQADQDSAARGVGERREDGVVGVWGRGEGFCHGAIFSQFAK